MSQLRMHQYRLHSFKGLRLTPANSMVQSSQPTFLTTRMRIQNLALKIITVKILTMIVVASSPADWSWSPSGAGPGVFIDIVRLGGRDFGKPWKIGENLLWAICTFDFFQLQKGKKAYYKNLEPPYLLYHRLEPRSQAKIIALMPIEPQKGRWFAYLRIFRRLSSIT